MTDNRIIELTADIVSAHVANNAVATADVSGLIQSVFTALSNADMPAASKVPKAEPAVPIRSSVKQDYIVCLDDGAKLKMLKRYLRTNFDMSPEDYRAKWNLPRDYPMVAPNYAEKRRTLANAIGLGRKKVVDTIVPVVEAVKATAEKGVAAVENLIAPAPSKAARPANGEVAAKTSKAKPAARKKLGITAAKEAAQEHLGTTPADGATDA